jgi:hypothetical protein
MCGWCVEVQLHEILTPAVDDDEWSDSCLNLVYLW